MKVIIEEEKIKITMSKKQALRIKKQLGNLHACHGLDLESLFNRLADAFERSDRK